MEKVKTLIIGSGPAGYTAAIYAARADLKPLLYTGMEPGGQLTSTTEVDNFPGYPDGVDGPTMMVELQKQAERFGTEVRIGHINKVEFSKEVGGTHKAFVEDGTEIHSDSIIISTGATAKYLGLPSEQKLRGGGVSACAVCDGFFYKDKKVLVVGGGDTAMEEATYLTKFASEVVIIHRRDTFRASKVMVDRVKKNSKVRVIWDVVMKDIEGTKQSGVKSVILENQKTKKRFNEDCDGVFLAIGHKPNTEMFENQLDMKNGYISINSGLNGNVTQTSVEGVFAAGDVADSIYRQAITSAGFGCMAALDAQKFLEE